MLLDASALLAYLHQEQGCLRVEAVLETAFISTVNWCEVVHKLHARSIDEQAVRENLEILGLRFVNFNLAHAETAGALGQITKPFGLSLGDKACLATAMCEKMPVMTADKIWQAVSLPLEVVLIR